MDTNVFLDALVGRHCEASVGVLVMVARELVEALATERTRDELLTEVSRMGRCPHDRRSGELVIDAINALTVVGIDRRWENPSMFPELEDPRDVPFFGLCLQGGADALVTSDRALLAMNRHYRSAGGGDPLVLKPEEFLRSVWGML